MQLHSVAGGGLFATDVVEFVALKAPWGPWRISEDDPVRFHGSRHFGTKPDLEQELTLIAREVLDAGPESVTVIVGSLEPRQ